MKLPIHAVGKEATERERRIPEWLYHRVGQGKPAGSCAVPTLECLTDAIGERPGAIALRALQLAAGGAHPDEKRPSLLGIPLGKKRVKGKLRRRHFQLAFSMIQSIEVYAVFWNPEVNEGTMTELDGEGNEVKVSEYNWSEYRQMPWLKIPVDEEFFQFTFGCRPCSNCISPDQVWPLRNKEPYDLSFCIANNLIRGETLQDKQAFYEDVFGEAARPGVKRYRNCYPTGYCEDEHSATKWWIIAAKKIGQCQVPYDANDPSEKEIVFQFPVDGVMTPIAAKNWIAGHRQRIEEESNSQGTNQSNQRLQIRFRRARPGDPSYDEVTDWVIILILTILFGTCDVQVTGGLSQRTRNGMIVDSWAMPTSEPNEVHEARNRLDQARDGRRRHDVDGDGNLSPDADPNTNRFRGLTVPKEVHPWIYQPEIGWVPRPALDQTILWTLEQYLTAQGIDAYDLGEESESAGSTAGDDESQPEAPVSMEQLAQLVRSHKESKGGKAPSTTGSTTIGGNTVVTATSAATSASATGSHSAAGSAAMES